MLYRSIEEAHNKGSLSDTFYYQLQPNKPYESLERARQRVMQHNSSIQLSKEQKQQITNEVLDLIHSLFE